MKNETNNNPGAKESQTLKAEYIKHLQEARNFFYNNKDYRTADIVQQDINKELSK